MIVATAERLLAEAVGRPCPAVRLDDLEAELGARLPDAYRDFLARRNGGVLHANAIIVPGCAFPRTDVYALFGLERNLETCDLRWNREVLRGVTGTDLLPIACDAGGSPFCLELGGGAGRIVYVPLEQPTLRHVVAACFEGFLRTIRRVPSLDPDTEVGTRACISASMQQRAARMGLCAA